MAQWWKGARYKCTNKCMYISVQSFAWEITKKLLIKKSMLTEDWIEGK